LVKSPFLDEYIQEAGPPCLEWRMARTKFPPHDRPARLIPFLSADHHAGVASSDCLIQSSELSNFDQTARCLLGILQLTGQVSSTSTLYRELDGSLSAGTGPMAGTLSARIEPPWKIGPGSCPQTAGHVLSPTRECPARKAERRVVGQSDFFVNLP